MAAITHVFTIGYVAELLAEDENWLSDIATDMDPEDGHLWIYGAGDEHVAAFTDFGIEKPQTAHRRPARRWKSTPIQAEDRLTCGPHRMDTVIATRRAIIALALIGAAISRMLARLRFARFHFLVHGVLRRLTSVAHCPVNNARAARFR